jgi:flagellar hook-basal body complex protein FliE
MAIHGIGSLPRQLPAIDALEAPSVGGASPAGAGSFVDALGKALTNVEQAQLDADASAQQVALGGGNLHETALALEKADIALRVATKVRNKLVETYQDIMRMPV